MGLGGMGSAYPTVGFPSHFHPIPYWMGFPSHLFPSKPLEISVHQGVKVPSPHIFGGDRWSWIVVLLPLLQALRFCLNRVCTSTSTGAGTSVPRRLFLVTRILEHGWGPKRILVFCWPSEKARNIIDHERATYEHTKYYCCAWHCCCCSSTRYLIPDSSNIVKKYLNPTSVRRLLGPVLGCMIRGMITRSYSSCSRMIIITVISHRIYSYSKYFFFQEFE